MSFGQERLPAKKEAVLHPEKKVLW